MSTRSQEPIDGCSILCSFIFSFSFSLMQSGLLRAEHSSPVDGYSLERRRVLLLWRSNVWGSSGFLKNKPTWCGQLKHGRAPKEEMRRNRERSTLAKFSAKRERRNFVAIKTEKLLCVVSDFHAHRHGENLAWFVAFILIFRSHSEGQIKERQSRLTGKLCGSWGLMTG